MSDEANYLNSNIILTRSKGAGTDYQSAVDLSEVTVAEKKKGIKPSISTSNKIYSWSLPAYVSSLEVQVNNQFIPFKNYQSVPQNTGMKITFINQGNDIDPKSIYVELNGTALVSGLTQYHSGSNDNYYSYDSSKGELIIQSVGNTSGQINISANDLFGQPYPVAPIFFIQVQIYK